MSLSCRLVSLFSGNSANQRIFRSAAIIALLTLLVRLIGLVREIAIANRFGTQGALDAYLTAFLIPNVFVTILAGSLNAALIPVFVEVKEKKGKEAANQLVGAAVFATMAMLLTVTFFLSIGAKPAITSISPGFSEEKIRLAQQLYYWLLPTIVLQGLITVWSAILNADQEFGLVALLPGIATSIALVFLYCGAERYGIFSLATGYSMGFCVQAIVLWTIMSRKGYVMRWRWLGWTPELTLVLSQYLPAMAGAFLMSGTGLVEQLMAASLPSGSVAALSYAARLTALTNGICAVALSTAVFPHLSIMVARADWAAVHRTIKVYSSLIFVVGGVGVAGIMVLSEPIVRLLFQHGSFESQDTHVVGMLQCWYVIQLPFFAAGMLLVRLISALQGNRYLMWGSLVSLLVNASLNALLRDWLGLNGVALTNSLMYVISFVFLSVVSWKLVSARRQHSSQ